MFRGPGVRGFSTTWSSIFCSASDSSLHKFVLVYTPENQKPWGTLDYSTS